MDYYHLEITSARTPDFCYCGRIEGSDTAELWISDGESAAHRYPSNPSDVLVHLAADHPGVMLPSRIANTRSLLMLTTEAITRLTTKLDFGPLEVYPFVLINHKRRVHSRDYAFLNPRTRAPLAHPASSFQTFDSSGKIYDCERWVLDRSALCELPDLVRSATLPKNYFVSQRFVDTVEELSLTNFVFEEVEHR